MRITFLEYFIFSLCILYLPLVIYIIRELIKSNMPNNYKTGFVLLTILFPFFGLLITWIYLLYRRNSDKIE